METTAKAQSSGPMRRPNVRTRPTVVRRVTYQDVLDAPEHMVAEILDGELVLSPRPGSLHSLASSRLHLDVGAAFDGRPGGGSRQPGGWWILVEPELHFEDPLDPGNRKGVVLVSDLAGWRRERMPRFPRVSAFEMSPDWVCEVISPSTARFDRSRKMNIYARERVKHIWFVDPLVKTLEVYRLEGEQWVVMGVYAGDEIVQAEPFDVVEFDMGRWWVPDEDNPDAQPDAAPGKGADDSSLP